MWLVRAVRPPGPHESSLKLSPDFVGAQMFFWEMALEAQMLRWA